MLTHMSTFTWQFFEKHSLSVLGAVLYKNAPGNHPMVVKAQLNCDTRMLLPHGSDCGIDGFDSMNLYQVKCMRSIGLCVVRDVLGMRLAMRVAQLQFDDMFLVIPANAVVSKHAQHVADMCKVTILRISDEQIALNHRSATARPHPPLDIMCPLQTHMVTDVIVAFKAGDRRISIEAPPGFGKTVIMRAIVRELIHIGFLKEESSVLELTYDSAALLQHQIEVREMRESDERICSFEHHTHAWLDRRGMAENQIYDVVFVDEGHHFDVVDNTRRDVVERLVKLGGVVIRQSALFALNAKDQMWGSRALTSRVTYPDALESGRVVQLHLGLVYARAEDVKDDATGERRAVATDVVVAFLTHSLIKPDRDMFGCSSVGDLTLVFFTSIRDAVSAYDAFCIAGGQQALRMSRIVYGNNAEKKYPHVAPPNIDELNDPMGGVSVVFAVGMLNEGVSINRTSDVWFADPRLSVKNTWQVAGRATRKFTDKHVARIWLPPVHDSIDGSACAEMLRNLMTHDPELRTILESRRAIEAGVADDAATHLRARCVHVACPDYMLKPTGIVEIVSCEALDDVTERSNDLTMRRIAAMRALQTRPMQKITLTDVNDDAEKLHNDAANLLNDWRQSTYRLSPSSNSVALTSEEQMALEAPGGPKWLADMIAMWKLHVDPNKTMMRIVAMRALGVEPHQNKPKVPLFDVDDDTKQLCTNAASLLDKWRGSTYNRSDKCWERALTNEEQMALEEPGGPGWLADRIAGWKKPVDANKTMRRIAAMRMLGVEPLQNKPKVPLVEGDVTLYADAASLIHVWLSSTYNRSATCTSSQLTPDEQSALEAPGGPRWLANKIAYWRTLAEGNLTMRRIAAVRELGVEPKKHKPKVPLMNGGVQVHADAASMLFNWLRTTYNRKDSARNEVALTSDEQSALEAPGVPYWLHVKISKWKMIACGKMTMRRIAAIRDLVDKPQPKMPLMDGVVQLSADAARLLTLWSRTYNASATCTNGQLAPDERSALEAPGGPEWLVEKIVRWKLMYLYSDGAPSKKRMRSDT